MFIGESKPRNDKNEYNTNNNKMTNFLYYENYHHLIYYYDK